MIEKIIFIELLCFILGLCGAWVSRYDKVAMFFISFLVPNIVIAVVVMCGYLAETIGQAVGNWK